MSEPAPSERTGPPLLHDPAPDFHARTTMGDRSLSSYRGQWLLLFSHPADFTPVCTSEFVAFARAAERFTALNCALLALSVDSLFSHLAWIRSIHAQFDVVVPFPIIEDPSMAIAQAYGMISPRARDSAMVRAIFVIDPDGIIRAISWYPMTTGRSVAELLRLVAALKMTDTHGVSTPEAWQPGGDVILPPPTTASEALGASGTGSDWYYRTATPDALPTAGRRQP
ncbi:peroxiredoxin [Lichenicoccus roseus]|uniref:Thioredoxin peroxidase n=1 Tax=Lichenicoccus roseus TaxID=2683649 RepID=A0A5R9J6V7_9PROT|nr:peroxiredoxin [Lichenicoccus roseus]TLU71086.1 peroxiredoxin [Lichenicoccus roseus]